MQLNRVADLLARGETVTFIARGHSMTPKIRDRQQVTLVPVDPTEVKRGDIVLARVGSFWYLHLVSATEKNRVQISNNRGRVNGWTARRNVRGRLAQAKSCGLRSGWTVPERRPSCVLRSRPRSSDCVRRARRVARV
jgi:hypothetical protein